MKFYKIAYDFNRNSHITLLFLCILLSFPVGLQAAESDSKLPASEISESSPQQKEAKAAQEEVNSQVDPERFHSGVDFFTYTHPFLNDRAQDKKQITVELFFAYECQYCLLAYDNLMLYQQLHPELVLFKLQPVGIEQQTFSPDVFYTLEALGQPKLARDFLFDSSGDDEDDEENDNSKHSLIDANNFYQWLLKHKVSAPQFFTVLNSENIQKKTEEAIKRTIEYGVFTIPLVVIDGQYVLTKSTLYDDNYTFAVLDFLIEKISNDRLADGEKNGDSHGKTTASTEHITTEKSVTLQPQ